MIRWLYIFILLPFLGVSQIEESGRPWSELAINSNIPLKEITIEKPTQQKIEEFSWNKNSVAVLTPVNIDFSDWKTTTLPNGNKLSTLKIVSPQAKAINLYYNIFEIPSGGKMYVYNEDKSKLLGAYTSSNNKPSKVFAHNYVPGEQIILEYNQPYGSSSPNIHINELGYFFRETFGTNGSADCEVDINCPEGDNWQHAKRGVVRMIIKIGGSASTCTGSLVNNTGLDCTPYILSAEHCSNGSSSTDYDQYIVNFNYEASSCGGSGGSLSQSMTGVDHIASGGFSGGSDFVLLKLESEIPHEYWPFFNGWKRTDANFTDGACIHHPSADVKKISTYNSTLFNVTLNGGLTSAYWGVNWDATDNGHGITEEGSSGSPIFNQDRLIVGTLTGGNSFCHKTDETDYFGKLSAHWNRNGSSSSQRLSDWLDPIGSGVTELKGTISPCINNTEELTLSQFKVWPNPTNEKINLQLESASLITPQISLIDVVGRTVYTNQYSLTNNLSTQINVSNLNSGTYYISVFHNGLTKRERIIISR